MSEYTYIFYRLKNDPTIRAYQINNYVTPREFGLTIEEVAAEIVKATKKGERVIIKTEVIFYGTQALDSREISAIEQRSREQGLTVIINNQLPLL